MGSPTLGAHSTSIRQPLIRLHTMMNSTKRSISVQLEPSTNPKELLWISIASLFYEHPCSCTKQSVPSAGTGLYYTVSLDKREEGILIQNSQGESLSQSFA